MKLLATTSAAAIALATLTGAASAQTQLTMWYHGAGNAVEAEILNGIVKDFNDSQTEFQVVIESFPQNSYNDSVVAAALAVRRSLTRGRRCHGGPQQPRRQNLHFFEILGGPNPKEIGKN